METTCSQSMLEILPDEILLEVCKYLLCTDILNSFSGLNYRMTQMITQYRHHVSFHKTSISIFDYLCVNVLPQIGSQIQSLVIDCCYSVLQDELFIKHFSEKMSIIFPNLKRISLISEECDQLTALLNSLHDLNHFVEIRLYSLFTNQKPHQTTFARSLIQANNHRITTILIDNYSSSLNFDDTDRYLNILRLRVNLKRISDLPSLFAVVPNVRYLDVIIVKRDSTVDDFNNMQISPLIHLTEFRLKSVIRVWSLEELTTLIVKLPTVQCLSLFLSTYDKRLTKGDIILPSLPTTLQQLNYAIYFISNTKVDEDDSIVSSWPPSYPVACFFNDEFLFIHTVPWHFPRLEVSSSIGKMISSHTSSSNGYDKHVEQVYLRIDESFTLGKSLAVLSQCRRVKLIIFSVADNVDVAKEEQIAVSYFPKLSRLIQISFYGSVPSDLKYFSFIFNAAPNLFRLDLPSGYLLKLIEDQQICHILGQRITSLCILGNEPNSSLVKFSEKHVPILDSVFSRVRDMYVDITHLPCSTTIVSNEDILEGSFLQNLSDQSYQENEDVISLFSSESMLLCLLKKFKEHKLISLCVDGLFVENIRIDTEQWLRTNTILREQQFKTVFSRELNRLLIWM